MLKPLIGWITTNCGIFLMRWKYQTILPASWETCMQDKKQHLELDMELDWLKSGKGVPQGCVFYFIWLTSRVLHAKSKARWTTSWIQDCQEKYQQPQICRWYHCNGRKWRGIKEPLDEVEREWKSWLKILLSNIIQFHHFMANRWWKSGSSDRFYFIGFKNHCRW